MNSKLIYKTIHATLLQKKKTVCLITIIALSVAYYFYHKGAKVPAMTTKIVETQILSPQPIQKTVDLIGTIHPKHSTILIAKATGLLDVLLPSGQKVKKGDLIAKIINPDIETSLKLSKATATIAKTQYQRLQGLQKTGFVSAREVEEKKQLWIDAKKEIAKTKIELKNMRFFAPFDGIIGAFKIKEGAQVNEGAPVVTVYDPSSLSVEVDIPCTNLKNISENQPVVVFNKAYVLNHVQKMIDDETHMCPGDVDIQCDDCVIGSSITVQLVVSEKSKALVVPTQALFLKNGSPHLYKVVDNKIELVSVKTGIQEKNNVEITSGLKPGDQIIAKSPERLYPGLEVSIYDPKVKG